MKCFTAITVFLTSVITIAMPKIGDHSVLSVIKNGVNIGTLEYELLQFDITKNQYLEVETQNFYGKKTVDQYWTTGMSDAQIASYLTHCPANGGIFQTVTVPAGTFPTCAVPVTLPDATETMWLGQVAMGVVKVDIQQGSNHLVANLVDFGLGHDQKRLR